MSRYAFPSHETRDEWNEGLGRYIQRIEPTYGMTLRDYFAAKALTGYITNGYDDPAGVAKLCYEQADAMLQEREK